MNLSDRKVTRLDILCTNLENISQLKSIFRRHTLQSVSTSGYMAGSILQGRGTLHCVIVGFLLVRCSLKEIHDLEEFDIEEPQ